MITVWLSRFAARRPLARPPASTAAAAAAAAVATATIANRRRRRLMADDAQRRASARSALEVRADIFQKKAQKRIALASTTINDTKAPRRA